MSKRDFYHDSLTQQPKFTHKDWSYNNQLKSRISCDQQKLADRVIFEAEKVIDEVKETTSKFKKESDYRLEERVSHIAFTVDELREQKRLGEKEQEMLKVWNYWFSHLICQMHSMMNEKWAERLSSQDTKNRIESAIENIKAGSLVTCEKCIVFRENRTGIGSTSFTLSMLI